MLRLFSPSTVYKIMQPMTSMMAQRSQVRTAQNVLDYKKVIVNREVEPDLSRKPRDPRMVYPRMRQVAAFTNR